MKRWIGRSLFAALIVTLAATPRGAQAAGVSFGVGTHSIGIKFTFKPGPAPVAVTPVLPALRAPAPEQSPDKTEIGRRLFALALHGLFARFTAHPANSGAPQIFGNGAAGFVVRGSDGKLYRWAPNP